MQWGKKKYALIVRGRKFSALIVINVILTQDNPEPHEKLVKDMEETGTRF